MSQHVDFLKSILKPKTQLPADKMIVGIAASVVLLIFASLLLWFYQATVNKQLLSAQSANQQETVAFQKLAEAYPLLAGDTPLVTKVLELEKNLHDKEAYFEELTHKTVRKPFSKYLIGISQATPEGLWLTGININQDSGNMSFEGKALTPALISLFLKKLEHIPPFVGEAFDLFAVKQKPDESGLHQFEVASDQLLNDELTKEKDANKKEETKADIQTVEPQKTNNSTVDEANDDQK